MEYVIRCVRPNRLSPDDQQTERGFERLLGGLMPCRYSINSAYQTAQSLRHWASKQSDDRERQYFVEEYIP